MMISGILIIVAAFAVAALGHFASNRAAPGQRRLLGLSRLGLAMLMVSMVVLAAGIWKEVETAREGEEAKELLRRNSRDLKLIRAKLEGLAMGPGVPARLAVDLRALSDEVSAVAASARYGNFRMSDFSRSDFSDGNFAEAKFARAFIGTAWFKDAILSNSNFEKADFRGSHFQGARFAGAILDGADFRGADLSRIMVNARTRLPQVKVARGREAG